MKTILTGAKPWKDHSWKANDKCKPCSKKQRGLEKKTMCYGSRFCPRDPFTTNYREVKGQTLGLTKGQRILEPQGSPLISVMSDLMNDSYLCIMLCKMKAQTPLMSRQRDNMTKDLSCRTQCVRGWDHRHLVRRGHLRPRPGRRIPTPQSHPSPGTIPHIKQYDKLEGIHQMNSSWLHQ